MNQRLCLNCRHYVQDDLDLEGNPIPETIPASFPFAGICTLLQKRMKDGWACGGWTAKSDTKRTDEP